MADTPVPAPAPAPAKPLPPWVQILINAGFTALAIFLATKYGIVLPPPVAPAPQPQITVLSFGQPVSGSAPLVPAAAK